MKNRFLIIGFAATLVLAGGVSYYASSHPDGFEKSAGDIGFLDKAKESPLKDSPLAEYGVAGVENERLSGGLAGVIGVHVRVLGPEVPPLEAIHWTQVKLQVPTRRR